MPSIHKIWFSIFLGLIVSLGGIVSTVDADEVPLYIKYRFQKETGRRWLDASHERQQKFLEEIRKRNRKARAKKQVALQKKAQEVSRQQSRRAVKLAKENARKQKREIRERRKQQRLAIRRQKAAAMRAKMVEKIRQARERSKSLRR